jgi:hypothetical protein
MSNLILGAVLLVFLFPGSAELAVVKKNYCALGRDAVNPKYILKEGEEIKRSDAEMFVRMRGKSGKIYNCWLPAGTEFITILTADGGHRKAERIKICGNPVLNEIIFPVLSKAATAEPAAAPAEAPKEAEVKQIVQKKTSVLRQCAKETIQTQSFHGGNYGLGISGASGAGIFTDGGIILPVTQKTVTCIK